MMTSRYSATAHRRERLRGKRLGLALVLLLSATVQAQRVERVVDGDTIAVQGIGKVRLIGVDTPELSDSRPEVEQMARSAAAFVEQTAGGRTVRLDYDWQRRDKYGRTLAYAYLPDGRMLNEEIIRAGYGFAYTKYPFKYQDRFPGIERDAREARRGLWAGGLETGRTAAALASADAGQTASDTVYVTRTGQAYHRDGCRSLSRSRIPMALSEAAGRYRPCSICRPPTPGGASATAPRSVGQAVSQASALSGTSATDRVVVITGTNFSGLYHREGCPVLASGGGLVTLSRTEAEGRHFGPHEGCISHPTPAALAPSATSPYAPPTPSPRATPSRETASGRCQAITKKGTQCSRAAKPGSSYCWQHGS